MSHNYVAHHNEVFSRSSRVYTPFLEYAIWFDTRAKAETFRLKESEWIDSGIKWWHKWENAKYERNKGK